MRDYTLLDINWGQCTDLRPGEVYKGKEKAGKSAAPWAAPDRHRHRFTCDAFENRVAGVHPGIQTHFQPEASSGCSMNLPGNLAQSQTGPDLTL